ncbi:TetR/AcrR family transcriptional regulator [Actinomadura barringtoniae]|uniref:TetR/AcrR family transcriptional regulator n=1 Tax=Actinomadura barringtoniae TaxID=1427535 RepID=A0A939PBU6_9ACTN|nr:TetR/AcrR family transcriptional regulator [Actinomadura barringtoniae]MBO2449720.1 TetR/AcrR family transcriptional regulator [Actinomadura barringtoniae]
MSSEPAPRLSRGARPSDDQLLDGARAVFAQVGVTAASMEQIADAARCTKPTLYAHFRSKHAIYLAALRRELNRLQAWLFNAYDQAAGRPAHEQIHTAMAAIFDYAEDNPDGFRLIFTTEAEGHLAAVTELITTITTKIAELIRAELTALGHKPDDDLHAVAALTVGTAIAGVQQAFQAPPQKTHELLELATRYTEHALTMLIPRQPQQRDVQHDPA